MIGINRSSGRTLEGGGFEGIESAIGGGIKKLAGSALGSSGLFHGNPLTQVGDIGTPYTGNLGSNNMNRNPGPDQNKNFLPKGVIRGDDGDGIPANCAPPCNG